MTEEGTPGRIGTAATPPGRDERDGQPMPGRGERDAEAMPRRDEEAVHRFVEHMALTWASFGFPRMAARVLMAMMTADDEALTAAELAARLGVSPAAISGAVRYLIQLGVLFREPMRGSRNDRYRLPDDAWYAASATKSGWLKQIADMSADGVKALGGPSTRAGARLAQMRDFFAFVQADMDALMDRWEQAKAAPTR